MKEKLTKERFLAGSSEALAERLVGFLLFRVRACPNDGADPSRSFTRFFELSSEALAERLGNALLDLVGEAPYLGSFEGQFTIFKILLLPSFDLWLFRVRL